MATEITMPKLSDTMTDGRFIGWRKSVGERVERGEVIAEVETDKAVMELEAFASGVLLKTMAREGETVPVGTVLGLIGEPEEEAAGANVAPEKAEEPGKEEGSPETAEAGKPENSGKSLQPVEPEDQVVPGKTGESPAAEPADSPEEEYAKASPLVRRSARELGIDLSQVQGSGPEGRILQEDLQVGLKQRSTPPESVEEKSDTGRGPAPPKEPSRGEAAPQPAASAMRRAISAAVSRSWQEIPHFTVTVEVDMQACREVVRELKGGEASVGYNDMVIKACAAALQHYPALNAASGAAADDGGVHVAFAVALPDGLLVPVIRHCERLSPLEISRESSRLAERARSGRLTQAEMSGGGFTVSNLGMFGVDEFMALIMPGQAAILAVGAVSERPAVREGKLVIAPTMRVTLSADHRIVDGAYAAAFMAELRNILEKPLPMFM